MAVHENPKRLRILREQRRIEQAVSNRLENIVVAQSQNDDYSVRPVMKGLLPRNWNRRPAVYKPPAADLNRAANGRDTAGSHDNPVIIPRNHGFLEEYRLSTSRIAGSDPKIDRTCRERVIVHGILSALTTHRPIDILKIKVVPVLQEALHAHVLRTRRVLLVVPEISSSLPRKEGNKVAAACRDADCSRK